MTSLHCPQCGTYAARHAAEHMGDIHTANDGPANDRLMSKTGGQ